MEYVEIVFNYINGISEELIFAIIAILTGTIIGFFSGMSYEAASTNIPLAITGFLGGFILANPKDIGFDNTVAIGVYVILFLFFLFGFNVIGNVFRRYRILDFIWGLSIAPILGERKENNKHDIDLNIVSQDPIRLNINPLGEIKTKPSEIQDLNCTENKRLENSISCDIKNELFQQIALQAAKEKVSLDHFIIKSIREKLSPN